MNKLPIVYIFLLTVPMCFCSAQKFGLEIEMGARADNNKTLLLQGNIREIPADYLHLQGKLLYNYSEKLFFSAGLGINQYSLKTVSTSSTFAFLATNLDNYFLLGIPLNADYKLLTFRKLDLEVGSGIQFLLTGLKNDVQNFGLQNLAFDDLENRAKRQLTVTNGGIHVIPNIHARLVFNFSPKFAAYFNYQYNQGIRKIFTRTTEINNSGSLGKSIITTNGTGIQTAFGVRFMFNEKVK